MSKVDQDVEMIEDLLQDIESLMGRRLANQCSLLQSMGWRVL